MTFQEILGIPSTIKPHTWRRLGMCTKCTIQNSLKLAQGLLGAASHVSPTHSDAFAEWAELLRCILNPDSDGDLVVLGQAKKSAEVYHGQARFRRVKPNTKKMCKLIVHMVPGSHGNDHWQKTVGQISADDSATIVDGIAPKSPSIWWRLAYGTSSPRIS